MAALKSDFFSKLLKMLLWVLTGFGVLELLSMIVYAIDIDFFVDWVYNGYGVIDIMGTAAYYICAIVYLIWIYRVHMDLQHIFPRYPRTPGKALVAILVPFYNLYGIPSTYSLIGNHYLQETSVLKREGTWISRLAVPLLLVIYASNAVSRMINRADEEIATGVLLADSIIRCVSYIIFLAICIFVSRGLNKVYWHKSDMQTDPADDLPAAPSV